MAQIYTSVRSSLPKVLGLHREWYTIDASSMPVGRIASRVASILMGKNRADYTPSVDMGGCVMITNTDKLVFTGKKMDKKPYFRYDNGRVGSLKVRLAKDQVTMDSTKVLYQAIKRMLPQNRQKDVRMNTRLKLLKGDYHNITQKMLPIV